MRIFSAQSLNAATEGSAITLRAANTYSSPALIMTGDLDGGTAGRQVDVVVEVSIPSGTAGFLFYDLWNSNKSLKNKKQNG